MKGTLEEWLDRDIKGKLLQNKPLYGPYIYLTAIEKHDEYYTSNEPRRLPHGPPVPFLQIPYMVKGKFRYSALAILDTRDHPTAPPEYNGTTTAISDKCAKNPNWELVE